MIDRRDLEKWAKRLTEAERKVATHASRVHQQPQDLLAAFNKISNPVLREQLVILIEIVAERPELLPPHDALSLAARGMIVH
jgi:hypothetical protein